MAPPTAVQDSPPLLPHHSGVFRTPDLPLAISSAPAIQASRYLQPPADSSLHHYHHHARTELPPSRHSPMLHAAVITEALHMTKRSSAALPLHHQHPLQAVDTCMYKKDCSNDGDDMDQIGPVEPLQMVSRAGGIPIRHMARIDNPTSRQVTFSKRRNGLLKKAYELSVLCDAEVGVIIFSATGRLSEFVSANTSMPKLLQRLQECSNGLSSPKNLFQDVEFWRREVYLLRDQIFHQKNLQSYMLGENILQLDVNDIQKVEHKLETALNKIKVQKAQLIQAEAQESWRREARLKEENDLLKRKLSELATLHALKEQMLMRNEARKAPCLGGDVMRSSMHESSPLAGEDECPSASSTFINQDINEPLKLHLGLELFPTKPAG